MFGNFLVYVIITEIFTRFVKVFSRKEKHSARPVGRSFLFTSISEQIILEILWYSVVIEKLLFLVVLDATES